MKVKAIEGLPIINAKRPLTITVTQLDINKADVKHPEGCAVARACVRQLHALEARVHLGRVYVKTTQDHWVRYMTPRAMRSEIVAFDRGGSFEPGTFTLPAPTKATKATGHQQGGPSPLAKSKRPPSKPRRPYSTIKNVRTGPA